MGFESVPWVDIWPSKNCCAKSFACLIHGDPLIRCSKGWPMAHFYHHSFAFAAFFVILVWSHLLFQNRKLQRPHRPDAPRWSKRLTHLTVVGLGKKKCHSYRSNFLKYFFFASMWFFFSLDVIPHTGRPNTRNQSLLTNLVVWAHRRLYFENFLRKYQNARLWTCQCRIHHLTSNSCNVIMDVGSQSAIEKWRSKKKRLRTAARRRKRSIFGTFGSYGIWWKLDESQNFYSTEVLTFLLCDQKPDLWGGIKRVSPCV